MPRNGSDVYSLPAGSTVVNGDTSDASDINTPLADIASDLNTPRPIVAGGTGASSASAARTALGLDIGTNVQAYSADLATYASNPLTAAELQQLQNIGTVSISATQWGYVAGISAAGAALIDDASASAQRTTLGLGTAATLNVGTSANNVVQLNGSGALPAVSGANLTDVNSLTHGTQVTTTSGSQALFTGIPAAVKRVTIIFRQVSLNDGSQMRVQIGTSSGLQTTGYDSYSVTGATAPTSITTGFVVWAAAAGAELTGHVELTRMDNSSNTWVSSHNLTTTGTGANGGGTVTLSGELERIAVASAASGTFDNGSINILYQ